MSHKLGTFELAVLIPAMLLVLYLIGVGPAVSFSAGTKCYDAVEAIYQPILALDGTPCRSALRWYLRLWGYHPVRYVSAGAHANNSLLRTGTRPGFRRGSSVSSCGDLVFNDKCQVPIAEVDRYAKSRLK